MTAEPIARERTRVRHRAAKIRTPRRDGSTIALAVGVWPAWLTGPLPPAVTPPPDSRDVLLCRAVARLTAALDGRRGLVSDVCLGEAATALRAAGLPAHAARAEAAIGRLGGDDGDIERLLTDMRSALATAVGMRHDQ